MNDALHTYISRNERQIFHRKRGQPLAMGHVSDHASLNKFNNYPGEIIPCEVCPPPSYNFFEVCYMCKDICLVSCVSHITSKDIDFCNVSGHKTILLYNETIGSLRKILTEVRKISEMHDPVETISIPVEKGPSREEQSYRQRVSEHGKWAACENKKNAKGGEGVDSIFVRVKRRGS